MYSGRFLPALRPIQRRLAHRRPLRMSAISESRPGRIRVQRPQTPAALAVGFQWHPQSFSVAREIIPVGCSQSNGGARPPPGSACRSGVRHRAG